MNRSFGLRICAALIFWVTFNLLTEHGLFDWQSWAVFCALIGRDVFRDRANELDKEDESNKLSRS